MKYFPFSKKCSATPPKEIPNRCTRTQGSSMWDMQTLGGLVKKFVWAAERFLLHCQQLGAGASAAADDGLNISSSGNSWGGRCQEGKALRVQPTP